MTVLDSSVVAVLCDCTLSASSMNAICHSYSLSPKYKNTYMSMSHCYRRVIESDGIVVNLPSFLPAVMTSSSSSVGVVMSCHVMSGKRRCSVAEDTRAHSLLGVTDH